MGNKSVVKKHLSIYSHDLDKIERKVHAKRRRKNETFATLCCRKWTHEHTMNIQCYSINMCMQYVKHRGGTRDYLFNLRYHRRSIAIWQFNVIAMFSAVVRRNILFFLCMQSWRKEKKLLEFMFDWLHCCNQSLNSALVEKFFPSGGIFSVFF